MARGYSAYILTEESRENLLRLIPPTYDNIVAHHMTWEFGVFDKEPPPFEQAWVVGVSDDGAGVQALIVYMNDTSKRPDGKAMHVTWSLAPGRKPVESNAVIEECGVALFDGIVPIEFEAKFIPF